jgi:hypothetical protein
MMCLRELAWTLKSRDQYEICQGVWMEDTVLVGPTLLRLHNETGRRLACGCKIRCARES